MKNLTKLDKIALVFLFGTIAFALYVYFTDSTFFDQLVKEDGFYENMTAVFLLFTSISLFVHFFKYKNGRGLGWRIIVFLMAVTMFFGAGEEISWGQRIFGIESNEFFNQNNAQQETNLHNMVVGDVKLNKLIFSNLMSIVFGIYFLVLPILYSKIPSMKNLLNTLGVAVAKPIHIMFFIIATILILVIIHHNRKWEIWEYTFALIMFLIVNNPWNKKEIFTQLK